MHREFFDPTPEEQVIALVERETALDRVTGSDPSVTDYVIEEPIPTVSL